MNESVFDSLTVMNSPWIIIIVVWSALWKAIALWQSARRNEKWWFLALMFINTAGILEIIYLALVVKLFSKSESAKSKKGKG